MKKWKIIGCIAVCIFVLGGYIPVSLAQTKNSIITFTVKFTIKPDKADEFQKLMEKIVPKVRAEKGNLKYILCRSQKDPRIFLFLEEYADQEAFQAHTKHLNEFGIDFSSYLDGAPVAEYYEEIAG